MGKLHLLERFLKEFGNPFYKTIIEDEKLVKELKSKGKIPRDALATNIARPLKILLELNKEYPIHVQFSPNGNYYDSVMWKIDWWWSITGLCTKANTWKKPLRNCFYIDCDRKETNYKDNKEYLEKWLWPILNNILPSLVVESWWWYHIAFIFDPKERELINETYSKIEMKGMLEFIHENFPGGDRNTSRYNLSAFIRAPYTWYKKHWEMKYIEPFKYSKDMVHTDINSAVLSTVESYDDLTYLSLEQIAAINALWKKSIKHTDINKNIAHKYWIPLNKQIDSIPFDKVIKKLSAWKYDRAWTVNPSSGRKNIVWKMVLQSNQKIYLKENSSWEIFSTNWYTWNKEKNYINNFTDSPNADVRPKGNVLSFLYYYFNNNYTQVESFMLKSFDIRFNTEWLSEDEAIIYNYVSNNNLFEVHFSNTRVRIQEKNKLTKNKTSKFVDILDRKLDILCKSKTTMTEDMLETDTEKTIFFVRNDNGDTVLLRLTPSKKEFNKKYQSSIGFFLWDDNDIGRMFQALEAIDIPEVDFRWLGWYYSDAVYFMGNKLIADKKTTAVEKFVINHPMNELKQISIKEYVDKLSELYIPEVSVLVALTAGIMASMNIPSTLGVNINPWVFFTGETEVWKTTIVDYLRQMIGIIVTDDTNPREWDINSVTAKPLKQYASQYEPMFITELTGDVSKSKVIPFRNIINKEWWARGRSSLENETYTFRSPVVIQWENLTEFKSINNRVCIFNLDPKCLIRYTNSAGKPDISKLEELKDYTCWKEIFGSIHKYYKTEWYIKNAYDKARELLSDNWVVDRDWTKWGFLLMMNSIIFTWYDDIDIVKFIKHWIKKSWSDSSIFVKNPNPAFMMKELIMQETIKGKCIARQYIQLDIDKRKDVIGIMYEITFLNEFINMNLAKLTTIITNLNELVGKPCVKVVGNTMIIMIYDNAMGKALEESLAQIFTLIRMKDEHTVEDITSTRDSF